MNVKVAGICVTCMDVCVKIAWLIVYKFVKTGGIVCLFYQNMSCFHHVCPPTSVQRFPNSCSKNCWPYRNCRRNDSPLGMLPSCSQEKERTSEWITPLAVGGQQLFNTSKHRGLCRMKMLPVVILAKYQSMHGRLFRSVTTRARGRLFPNAPTRACDSFPNAPTWAHDSFFNVPIHSVSNQH